jgi:arylformamidase
MQDLKYKRLIDISQPVKSNSAAFPGDTQFKRELVLSYKESQVVNLTSLTMSPHVGTHVDAPGHIKGDMDALANLVGAMPLEPFIGRAAVIDFSPKNDGISWQSFEEKLRAIGKQDWLANSTGRGAERIPERILLRTMQNIRYEVFEEEYAFFETDLVKELAERGVKLLGIDAPSADHVRSKTLEAHHELDRAGMVWLENLDLSNAREGEYYLIALPIKFMELEASPVRAVLLEF